MNNMLQIELWRECNNHCKFCYLQEENRKQSTEYKLNAIKNTIEIINDEETWNKYDSFGLIGGEFFQGQLNTQELNKSFAIMMKSIENKYLESKIKSFWLTATLTEKPVCYGKSFEEFITNLDNLAYTGLEKQQDIWLCTSYDTIGRFHTEQSKQNWINNMKFIKENTKYLHTTTSFIITQDLIETYNRNKNFFNDFRKEYNTHIYFKCPDIGCNDKTIENFLNRTKLDKFLPKRCDFIKFLYDMAEDGESVDLFNREYRAATLYENIGGKSLRVFKERQNDLISAEDAISSCGHAHWYSRYIDSDKCMMCDRDIVFREIEDE